MKSYKDAKDDMFEADDKTFSYDFINGIGESDYENEDLFSVEIDENNENSDNETLEKDEIVENSADNDVFEESFDNKEEFVNEEVSLDKSSDSEEKNNSEEEKEEKAESNANNVDKAFYDESDNFGNISLDNSYSIDVVNPSVKSKEPEHFESKYEEYLKVKEEKIPSTDLNALFERVGINVLEASDIFRKNTEMKAKIDNRFEELKKLQSEVEKAKKRQYEEIDAYKEEVLNKLTEKKKEIEERVNRLKEIQAGLEKEKEEFEEYRKSQKEQIESVQKEIQEAYDTRREELNHVEDILRKQKDDLDEERNQLSLDKIKYESDKTELANNMLKFNEIVDTFTNGMNKLNKE